MTRIPFFRFVFLAAVVCGLAHPLPGRAATTNPPPALPRAVLENEFLRAEVAAEDGAALMALANKPDGVQLLAGPSLTDALLLPDKTIVSLTGAVFQAVTAAGKDRLEFAGSPAAFPGLKIVKRYRLPAGVAALLIEYELANTGAAPLDVCLATPVRPAAPGGKALLAVPTSGGAVSFPEKSAVLPLGGRLRSYLYDLDSAWAASLSAAGDGVVAAIEPRHLSCLSVDQQARRFEFVRTTITIAPGQTVRTSGWIMPVRGFKRMSGAAGEWAGAFGVTPAEADGAPPLAHVEYSDRIAQQAASGIKAVSPADVMREKKSAIGLDELETIVAEGDSAEKKSQYQGEPIKVQLQLLSARPRRADVSWSFRARPRGEWQALGEEKVECRAGQAARLAKTLKLEKKGSYVLRAEIREGGKTQAVFEQPLVAGAPSGFYAATPPEREGKVYEAFRPALWVPSDEVERPHVALTKPLAAGPVRMLISIPSLGSRGVVEIRQRLDATTDYVVAGGHYATTGEKLRAQPEETLRMRAYLARPHEVIMLADVNADYFPIDVMDEIFRQVAEEGVGLVLMNSGDTLGVLKPLLDEVKRNKGSETAAAASFAPGFPGLITGACGKGRVALVEGALGYIRPDWYGQSDTDVQGLIQAILWAARGLPEPALERKAAPPMKADRDEFAAQPFSVTVLNPVASAFRGKLRLQARRNLLRAYPSIYSMGNSFAYRPAASWEDALPAQEALLEVPAKGRGRTDFKLPLLAAGEYDLDLQVLDSQGAVIDFQRLPLTLTGKARTVSADLATEPAGRTLRVDFSGADRPWFGARAGDTLRLEAGIEDAGAAVQARLQAFDPWGRMPFDQKAAVKREGDKVSAVFTQPLHSCIHMISILRLSLLDAQGNTLSEERLLNFIFPRLDRLPAFELRGYAEVRVNNDVSGYDVRTGGEGPFALAWHNIRKSDYGGVIGGAKILAAGDRVLNKFPEITDRKLSADWSAGTPADEKPAEKTVGQVEDGTGLEDGKIDLKKGYFRVPCFYNPKERQGILDDIKRNYTANSICYPFKGFLTDEFWYAKEYDPKNTVSFFRRAFIPDRDLNICRCPYCAKAFIAYARKLFKDDLAALNAEWNTAFKAWADVEIPLTVSDKDNPPPESAWPYILAHRDFIEDQVAGLVGDISRTVKAVDPDCETGMSGLWKTGLHDGIDVYRLARLVKYNMLYSDIDMWTDFGDSEAVNWTGYGGKYGAFAGSATIWRSLVSGLTGIGYYGKEDNPMHKPDFTFYDEPACLFREVRGIRDAGIDQLVVRHRYRDPIALYYCSRDVSTAQLEDWLENPPNFIAGMRNGGRSYSEFVYSAITSYRNLCNNRYLQPFWTANAQLEEGSFGGKYGTPKLVLLPYAQCLSPRQAETLRQFVKNGGVLVGDVHTGWRDGFGRLQPRGALDDVFGIARQGDYRMRRRGNTPGSAIPIDFGKEFGAPFSLAFAAVGPGDVKPVTAKALASYKLDGREQPAFLVNEFGKGKAVYLNFIPAGYASVEVAGQGEVQDTRTVEGRAAEQFHRFFGKILDLAQIRQPLEFATPQRLSVGRFGEGDLTYLGVVAGRSAESILADYRVKIGEKRHVYSVRRREYLGFTDEFPVRLSVVPRVMGDIYSLLPYKVEGLAVELAAPSLKAGERLAFTVKVLPAEAQQRRHVIAARALDPQKRDPKWYRCAFETVNGAAAGFVDTAAGDVPGLWTLQLTDAASGERREMTFEVKAP